MPHLQGQHLLWPPYRPLSERFGAEFFRELPESPGVYLMCGEGDGVLYVGKARNLRRRLGTHRSTPTDVLPLKQRRLLQSVRRIYWDLCPDEAAADQRERELIRTLQPRFNTVGARPAAPWRLAWRWHGTRLEWELEVVSDLEWPGDSDDGRHRVGPLPGLRSVHAAMLRLIWWQLFPEAMPHELPACLREERPPDRWAFEFPPGMAATFDPQWMAFLSGTTEPLLAWLLPAESANADANRFRQRWQERDLERMTEFAERLSGMRSVRLQEEGE